MRLFENFTDFATFVCPKCRRFLRIGLRFENRQFGGVGREGFVNVGLWRGEVGTKKRGILNDAVSALFSKLGWQMGLEPTTLGTTIRCSNQLSYCHQL